MQPNAKRNLALAGLFTLVVILGMVGPAEAAHVAITEGQRAKQCDAMLSALNTNLRTLALVDAKLADRDSIIAKKRTVEHHVQRVARGGCNLGQIDLGAYHAARNVMVEVLGAR